MYRTRKNVLIFFIGLCLSFTTQAQVEVVAQSEYFEEPGWGPFSILVMKSGQTAMIRFDRKGFLHFSMYGTNYKLMSYQELKPANRFSYYENNDGQLQGIFECDKKIAVFYSKSASFGIHLYRLILDPSSGKIIDDVEVGVLRSLKGMGFAVIPPETTKPDFFIKKDEYSENYAVVLFNSYVSDRNERIEVVHFDSTHQEISRAFCHSPGEKYKFMEYLDLVVLDRKEVVLMVQGSSQRVPYKHKNSASLYRGRLTAGGDKFELEDLNYTDANMIHSSLLKYNIHTEEFLFLTMNYTRKPGAYVSQLLKLKNQGQLKTYDIEITQVNEIASGINKKKYSFMGTPQNLIVHNDGTFSIVFEEMFGEALEDLGIIKYDSLQNELKAVYLPKYHLNGFNTPSMYQSLFQYRGIFILGGNQFRSSKYIHTGKNEYVLFNEIERNQEAINKGKKITAIRGIDECEAFIFNLNKGQGNPQRERLFNYKENGKPLRTLLLFSGSDYNKETKILATVAMDYNKKKDKTRLIWIKIE